MRIKIFVNINQFINSIANASFYRLPLSFIVIYFDQFPVNTTLVKLNLKTMLDVQQPEFVILSIADVLKVGY